ncbi:response regulator transcription factor [Microbacterium aquimaris]|uniref:Response regulator n=1 Tax=Microbacterium aquimaris TaxID=459816 RepID=A0ABU5N523_9MICO|nr:response regulator transcription factor [Microbacterium aquimaris]MDZ8161140.1 response regulator [Microbacterium aquimaris]
MTDPSLDLKTAVIVEDDPDIRHLLREVLEAAGFSTVSVGNGIDGVRAVASYRPLITTLDVNMPGIDGFEAARRIRAQSDTYIIMLTGLEDEADVVLGLGAGADEYITKPFRPREFRARIDAMLRRPRQNTAAPAPRQDSVGPSFPGGRNTSRGPQPAYDQDQGWDGPPPGGWQNPRYDAFEASRPDAAPPRDDPSTYRLQPDAPGQWAPTEPERPAPGTDIERTTTGGAMELAGPSVMTHRDLQVNPDTRVVIVGGEQLELTRTEFDLLATLMESKRRVRSKADLTLVLRGESYVTSYFVGEADKRAIEAHMTNLRRKLGDNPTNPRYIETVRGVGYRMTSELSAST